MVLNKRLIVVLCAAVLFFLVYLQISFSIGHLSHDMTWDDISYALSASDRLDALLRGGIIDLAKSFVTAPPHSVYAEVIAICAVLIFGLHDVVFYASNFLLILAVSLFLLHAFKRSDHLSFILIYSFALISPLAFCLIDNFRPDFALGLATTAMVWWTLKGIFFGRRRDMAWGGLAFGAALLIKPTFFAHTLAVAFGLALLSIFIQVISRGFFRDSSLNSARVLPYLLIGAILTSPYFFLAGGEIFQYFWTNTQGEQAAIWSFSESASIFDVVQSFLFGGYQRNGGMHVPVAAVVSVLLLPMLYFTGKKKEFLIVSIMLLVAVSSFTVLVLGRHKSQYFFATFQMLIMLSGIYAFASVSEKLVGLKKAGLIASFAALTLFAVTKTHTYLFIDTGMESLRSVSENQSIAQLIGARLAAAGRASNIQQAPATIFVATAGPVSMPTIKWEVRKAGFFVTGTDIYLNTQISDYVDLARRSDFTVIPYRITAEYVRDFPSAPLQAEFASILLNDAGFRKLPPRTDHDRYMVLERISEVSAEGKAVDMGLPGSLLGFGPEEGPYPQWNLPRVIWMASRIGKVCMYETGNYVVNMELMSPLKAGVDILSPAGDKLAQLQFTGGDFQTTTVEQSLSPQRPCISIVYDASVNPSGERNYVLFKKIAVRKSEEN